MGDSDNPRKRLSHEESEGSSSIFKKGTQTTINSIFKKSEREDAC